MTLNRKIANLIKTDGQTKASVLTNADQLDSAEVTTIVTGKSLTFLQTLDSLPTSNLSSGQRAFVESDQRFYISNGAGWYNTGFVNLSPNWDSTPLGSLDSTSIVDSATDLIIVAKAVDSDNSNLNLINQSFASDSAQYLVNISNDSSVWTFDPKSDDSISASVTAGDLSDSSTNSFVYTFKWSDGINFVSKAITINYNFSRILFGSMDFGDPATNNPVNVNFASSYQNLGTGDFCVECWVYRDNTLNHLFATSRANVSTVSNGDWWFDVYNGEYRVMFKESNGTLRYLHNYSNTTFASGSWIHVAMVREGTTLRAYYNGSQEASGYLSAAAFSLHGSEGAMSLGGFYDTSSYAMVGHISNFRISVGDAVYPSGTSFTPSTDPLGINDDATWSVVLAHDPNSIDTVLESTSGIVSSITKNTNRPTSSSDNPFS